MLLVCLGVKESLFGEGTKDGCSFELFQGDFRGAGSSTLLLFVVTIIFISISIVSKAIFERDGFGGGVATTSSE